MIQQRISPESDQAG